MSRKTCCQCPSPARAKLDGRFYCFAHVPLMTNWKPVKKKPNAGKKKTSAGVMP